MAYRVFILFVCLSFLQTAWGNHRDYESQTLLEQTFDNHALRGSQQQKLAQAGVISPAVRPVPLPPQHPTKPRPSAPDNYPSLPEMLKASQTPSLSSLENRLLSNEDLKHLQSLLHMPSDVEIKALLEERDRLLSRTHQLDETANHINTKAQNLIEEKLALQRRKENYEHQRNKLCRYDPSTGRWPCNSKTGVPAMGRALQASIDIYKSKLFETKAEIANFLSNRDALISMIVSWEARAKELNNKIDGERTKPKEKEQEIYEGMTIYRVWGGPLPNSAKEDGPSWTSVDPRLAPRTPERMTYRFKAGLPASPLNTGEWLAIGILKNKNGIEWTGSAKPGPNGGGGWPEIRIRERVRNYVQILQSVPMNPPF